MGELSMPRENPKDRVCGGVGGPRKIREEVRRAYPVKCSDTEIWGREKMFGHGQTYLESSNICSDRGKDRKILAHPHHVRFVRIPVSSIQEWYETSGIAEDWTGQRPYLHLTSSYLPL